MKYAFLLLMLGMLCGCDAVNDAGTDWEIIPHLNSTQCGCKNGSIRIKIAIEDGTVLCMPEGESMHGDLQPVCVSDDDVAPHQCTIKEHNDVEELKCKEPL